MLTLQQSREYNRFKKLDDFLTGEASAKSGEALANATIQLKGTDKDAVTDLKGFYRLERAIPRDYEVAVAADGYAT